MLPGLTPFLVGSAPLVVTVAPLTGRANRVSGTDGTLFVSTVTGGAGGYTYLWSYVSGSGDFAPLNSTASQTRFSFGGSEIASSLWNLTVTDANGRTASLASPISVDGAPV